MLRPGPTLAQESSSPWLRLGRQGGHGSSKRWAGPDPCPCVGPQGDVVLQSDHVIETLTKTALSADRVNNININQGR